MTYTREIILYHALSKLELGELIRVFFIILTNMRMTLNSRTYGQLKLIFPETINQSQRVLQL